jgi:hypothetical protein
MSTSKKPGVQPAKGYTGKAPAGRATQGKKKEAPPPSRRNLWIGAGGLAVVALAAFLILRPKHPGGMALALPKPEATLASPTFVWWSYKGVTNYELEIVTESGDPVYSTSTRDTTAQVPADRFRAGQKYLWLVRAIVNGETKEASRIDRFTYQP